MVEETNMDNYKLIIETVTTETSQDWEDDDGSDFWADLFEQNRGKLMIQELWMTGEETVGDCQTLMEDHYKPIFWDSAEEAISYIIGEYQTSTKAIQEVVLDKDSIYKVQLGGAEISQIWSKNFSQIGE